MKALCVMLAVIAPVVGALVVEAVWPHGGSERAFVFVVAVALSIAMGVALVGGDDYTPSVKKAIDDAQDGPATSSHGGTSLGCLGRALVIVTILLLGLVVLVGTICGGRF